MLSFGDTIIDNQRHEILEHGPEEFPIACYYDDLGEKTVPWHWHDEVEIGIVRDGKIMIKTPEGQCEFAKGEGFFINSGILHMIQRYDSKECYIDSLVFHAKLIGGSIESIFWRKYIRPIISRSDITMLKFNTDSLE